MVKIGVEGDSMKKEKTFYLRLFFACLYISAFTLGGGYVMVPLMKKRFVDEYGWIEEKEMLDMVAIAQSSPGAMAINASIIIGYKLAGFFGAVITIGATILPPLVIMSVVSMFYVVFKESVVVNAVLTAMGAGVAAVIADVVINMSKGIFDEKSLFAILVMVISFIGLFLFSVDVKLVILVCGTLGFLKMIRERKSSRDVGGE